MKFSPDDPILLLIKDVVRTSQVECSKMHSENTEKSVNRLFVLLETVQSKQDKILENFQHLREDQIVFNERLKKGSGNFATINVRLSNLENFYRHNKENNPLDWFTKNFSFIKIIIIGFLGSAFVLGFIFAGGGLADLFQKLNK